MARWLNSRRGLEKINFWFTKFWGKHSVNQNFSLIMSLLFLSHLAMNQALLYLKTNQPVCLFTNSKDFKISPSSQEKSGVSNVNWTVNHPVVQLPTIWIWRGLILFFGAVRYGRPTFSDMTLPTGEEHGSFKWKCIKCSKSILITNSWDYRPVYFSVSQRLRRPEVVRQPGGGVV